MNSVSKSTTKIHLPDEMATQILAARVAANLKPGMILGLIGDLGAGKTTFTKYLAASLGGDASNISSPTFTIINEQQCDDSFLMHCDFYRLESSEDLDAIGGIELFYQEKIAVIEWIDKINIMDQLPPEKVFLIKFRHLTDGSREAEVSDVLSQ